MNETDSTVPRDEDDAAVDETMSNGSPSPSGDAMSDGSGQTAGDTMSNDDTEKNLRS